MMKASLSNLLRGTALVAGLGILAGSPSQAQENPAKTKKADTKKAEPKPAPAESDNDTKAELLKLNSLTGVEAMQTRLTELIKEKEQSKKLVAMAVEMAKDAKTKEQAAPFNYNASLILAKTAHSLKELDSAELFYERCAEDATKLQSANKIIQAYEGLIQLYQDQKKFNAVEEVCQKFMDLKGGKELDQAKPFVLEKLILAKARQGQTDEALRMTEGLVQIASDEGKWYFMRLKGQVLHDAGKVDDSIDAYKEAISDLDKSKLKDETKERFQDSLRYGLSGIYVEANKIGPAAELLESLAKKHPDNPTYKNDLGFIWCDHDMKLPEAEKLIREAIDLDKKLKVKLKAEGAIDDDSPNAAYLDSLGWVLFKQKKFKEALKYLEEAAKDPEEGAHIEIFDHVADCQAAMGNKKAALETLLKAIKLDDVSKRDAERRRKMTEKIKKLRSETKVD